MFVINTVDVVIPVYGNLEITRQCLASLQFQLVQNANVIVVDDAGPTEVITPLQVEFPDVTFLRLSQNVGFASACNAGIRAGTGEVVIVMNNDVEADPNLISSVLSSFTDGAVGSVAPIILRPDGLVDAYGLTCDPTLAGYLRFEGRPLEDVDAASSYELLGPYGAIAAYRRSALESVGLFDEQIFMYGEELELAIRLQQSGWSSVGTGVVGGVHIGSATTGRGSPRQRYLAGFGRGYILRKYSFAVKRRLIRILATEFSVIILSLCRERSTAAARGRIMGLVRGSSTQNRARLVGIDADIGFIESIHLRRRDWSRRIAS